MRISLPLKYNLSPDYPIGFILLQDLAEARQKMARLQVEAAPPRSPHLAPPPAHQFERRSQPECRWLWFALQGVHSPTQSLLAISREELTEAATHAKGHDTRGGVVCCSVAHRAAKLRVQFVHRWHQSWPKTPGVHRTWHFRYTSGSRHIHVALVALPESESERKVLTSRE